MAPPDPMPNSEVKRNCANGSVGIPHVRVGHRQVPFLSGNNSVIEPPDSIPNSEVKSNSADGSVGIPHVRVGHYQIILHNFIFQSI